MIPSQDEVSARWQTIWGFEGDAGLGGLNDHFTAVIDQFNEMRVQ